MNPAIMEPGPYYIGGIEYQVEDTPEDIQVVTVNILANSPMVENHPKRGSIPIPSEAMVQWIKIHNSGYVAMGFYEPVINEITFTVDHFVIPVYFEDNNTAMLFKLTWSGL
jgi:hypothetical protein